MSPIYGTEIEVNYKEWLWFLSVTYCSKMSFIYGEEIEVNYKEWLWFLSVTYCSEMSFIYGEEIKVNSDMSAMHHISDNWLTFQLTVS